MIRSLRVALLSGVALMAIGAGAQAQSDPAGRIGRLSYLQGTVSYHDAQQDTWSSAVMNTPLTSGDSLWTEPNGHDEISIAGTRVRMDGDTQLDMLAIDDSRTRLQLDQGRLDIRAFRLDGGQPYEIVTPRGLITLEQQGDYYVHAGSTDDPTVLGVRSGAAQIQTPNGQVLTVRAGEIGEVSGSGDGLRLVTVRRPPPAEPAYWAQRDREITYAQPQYVTADITGYEDFAVYGSWTADPDYGEVWYPNSVPVGWAPYRTGEWVYQPPYGWTWVDTQPWGFAPYHYGRWAERNDRWFWVPPEHAARPVYAPALVAFVGGVELGVAIGQQSHAPVGWFPLGPHEAYVPPYATDRAYYNRVNAGERVQRAMLDERWQRAEHHEAIREDHQHELMNRRFATVVSAEDFAHSRPVQQAALKVSADKIAAAPVAPVAAPPAPHHPIAAEQQAGPARPNEPSRTQPQAANLPTGRTRLANMETIGRPTPGAAQHAASGPKIEAHAVPPAGAKPALPPLAPHAGAAPAHLEGEHAPAAQHPGQLPPVPQANRAEPNRAEPQRPNEPPHGQPQHASPPPQAQHAEPPRAEPQRPAENDAPAPQARHPEPQRPEAHTPAPQPSHLVEPPHGQPQAPHQAEAPRPQMQPQHEAPQARAPEPQRAAPPPQAHAEPPRQAAPPPPQHLAPSQTHAEPPHRAAPVPQMHATPQEAHAPPQASRPAPQAHPEPPHQAPQNHQDKK
jgi:hypothetical protein